MSIRTLYLFVLVFAFATVGLTACANPITNTFKTVDIESMPVYPDAKPVEYDYNSLTMASDRQARRARLNGHHSYSIAFVLPKGTTAGQVKKFYLPVFAQLGGLVVNMMGDRDLFGTINLNHGAQVITINYDAILSEQPTLVIEDFIPNTQP